MSWRSAAAGGRRGEAPRHVRAPPFRSTAQQTRPPYAAASRASTRCNYARRWGAAHAQRGDFGVLGGLDRAQVNRGDGIGFFAWGGGHTPPVCAADWCRSITASRAVRKLRANIAVRGGIEGQRQLHRKGLAVSDSSLPQGKPLPPVPGGAVEGRRREAPDSTVGRGVLLPSPVFHRKQ